MSLKETTAKSDLNTQSVKGDSEPSEPSILRLTIPTGRIQEKVLTLLDRVGVKVTPTGRSYKPACSDAGVEVKMLKAQNIPSLVALGRHDCGFSGYDWIEEQQAEVMELLDLEYDPVRIVAAVPEALAVDDLFRKMDRPIIVASEYRRLATDFIERNKLNAILLQTFGATEALPPEDADMIIDNTATGSTLKANRLTIVETVMRSTTRFFCNKQTWENKAKRTKLEELVMLMKSTIRAKEKVLLEMNVSCEDFPRLVSALPCMRAPTVSELYNGDGYAIKIAVASREVPSLIPRIVALGGRDILEYKLEKIV